jgi:hypothetical protein
MTREISNKIGNTILKGLKNSWKILPFGSFYNNWKNNQYKTDSVFDAVRNSFHEIYAGVPLILLVAYLYNGFANDKWTLQDYFNKSNSQITMNKNNQDKKPQNTFHRFSQKKIISQPINLN